jgi:hypothetical protein
LPLPRDSFHLRRTQRAALVLEAFDYEGGAGLKDKDDFIGCGRVDVTDVLNAVALKHAGACPRAAVALQPGGGGCCLPRLLTPILAADLPLWLLATRLLPAPVVGAWM